MNKCQLFVLKFKKFLKDFLLNKNIFYIVFFLTLLGALSFFTLGSFIINTKNGTPTDNQLTMDDELESLLISNIPQKNLFLDLNGSFRLLFGQKEMNGIVRLNNGYLAEPLSLADSDLLSDNADGLLQLQNALDKRGIPLLYVLTPFKIQAGNKQLPDFTTDYTNESMDLFVSELQKRNINFLDLRRPFSETYGDCYKLFYRTDHHWNIDGGFAACSSISDRLGKMLGVPIDQSVLDINNYTRISYPASHLGYYGRRTGIIFAGGADDFDMLLPNFPTSVVNLDTGEQGSFEDVMVNLASAKKGNLYDRYTYESVLPLSHFHVNNSYTANKKVLLICDSMGKAVLPYLTLVFGDVKCLDAYSPLESFTTDVLEEYDPDIVIVMHYAIQIFSKNRFVFSMQ